MTCNARRHSVTNCTQTVPHFDAPAVHGHAHTAIIKVRCEGVAMNKLSALPWWSAVGSHQPTPPGDDDYADMGTAFGLDASLRPDGEAPGVAPHDAADLPAPAPTPADRLNGRSVI